VNAPSAKSIVPVDWPHGSVFIYKKSGGSPEIIAREKAQAVKKNSLLEIIETSETLDDIGELDLLKEWLVQRRDAFSKRSVEYGLPTPKGSLILGIPSGGKSLTAPPQTNDLRNDADERCPLERNVKTCRSDSNDPDEVENSYF
jgi:hypothetical protein